MRLFRKKQAAPPVLLAGDHSTSGSIIGGSLKAAGMGNGIIRYACAGRGNVNITPAEVRDLQANGIPLGIVCEHEANWLLNFGSVAGRVHGSQQITRACGVPDGVTYLAADWDVTNGGFTSPGSLGDRNMQGIAHALGIAAGVIGRKNVGFYGSYYAIVWLIQHGWGDIKFWQTEAWSHGNLHPAAHLFQRAASRNVHGVDVDIDVVLKADWGQRVTPKPPPPPPPPPKQHASGTFVATVTYDHDAQKVTVHQDPASKIKTLGDYDETIHLAVDLAVGKKQGSGGWAGHVAGKSPR